MQSMYKYELEDLLRFVELKTKLHPLFTNFSPLFFIHIPASILPYLEELRVK